jgi:tetratricopeptide (TPR) repeat protein
MTTWHFTPFLLLALVIGSTDAGAKPGTKDKAKKLFKAGKALYAAGEFDDAAAKFTAGYALDHEPLFLLNAAQSYRSANKPAEALRYYQAFIKASPETPLRPQVDELIRELKAKVQPPPRRKPDIVVAPPPPPPPPPPRESAPFYKRWWFWTVVGVVVVGTAVGIGVGVGAREPDYVKEGGLGAVRW